MRRIATYYQNDPTTTRVTLPFHSKKVVFELYILEVPDPCKDSYFFKVWRKEVTKVILRKWLRFALCDTCIGFRETHQALQSPEEKKKLRAAETKHYMFVKRERGAYKDRSKEAETNPERVISIIDDGADQGVYAAPYHCRRTHGDEQHYKIKTFLMGVIAHGRDTYAFPYLENVKHGTNMSIECLHRVLLDIYKADGKLAPKLWLQEDNTTKCCKSCYKLGYCALLVAWGLFDEVVLSFLPVGHTHEDIDQFFSRLAVYLRTHHARSRKELCQAVHDCYLSKFGKRPKTENIDNAANISEWLEPYLNNMKQAVNRPGITNYHQFRLRRSSDGSNVHMQVREWATTGDPWRGLQNDTSHFVVFKTVPEPQDMVDGVPPAQRKELVGGTEETNKAHMK